HHRARRPATLPRACTAGAPSTPTATVSGAHSPGDALGLRRCTLRGCARRPLSRRRHLPRGACTSPSRCAPRGANTRCGTSGTSQTAMTPAPTALSRVHRELRVQSPDLRRAPLSWSGGRRRSYDRLIFLADRNRFFRFAQQCQCPSSEMVRAECVLESRVGGAGVNEIGPAELADVAQTLKNLGVNEL